MSSIKSPSLQIIKNAIKQHWIYLIGILGLCIISSVLTAVTPLIYKVIIDSVIPEKNIIKLVECVGIMVLLPLVDTGFLYLKDRWCFVLSDYSCRELRRVCFSKTMAMNYCNFESQGAQKIMQNITRGIGRIIDVYILGDLFSFITNIVQLAVVFSVLAFYNWKIALLALAVMPMMQLIIKLLTNKVSSAEKDLIDVLNKGEKYLLQTFLGMKTVRSFNGQEKEKENFEEWLLENKKANWRVRSAHSLVRIILPKTLQQMLLGVIFTICAILVFRTNMTLGVLIAIITYVPATSAALNGLFSLKIGKTAIKKIADDLDEVLSTNTEEGSEEGLLPEPGKSVFDLKNVRFTYGRNDFNLQVDNLQIQQGDFVVIVGESGGGKSSLFDIFNKFYPISEGCVLFRDKNINHVSTRFLRHQMAYTLQDVYLFQNTIAENIIYPSERNEEKLRQVIKDAQLVPFLQALPEGEETLLHEFGSNLSGGECQRIAFARALYKDAPILLLDEPTAALDALTSQEIFNVLKRENEQKQKTVILITHDVSKINYASKVVVIKDGKVAGVGQPELLKKENSILSELYQAQNKLDNAEGEIK